MAQSVSRYSLVPSSSLSNASNSSAVDENERV